MRYRQLLPSFALIRRQSPRLNEAVSCSDGFRKCVSSATDLSSSDLDHLLKPVTQNCRPGAPWKERCVAGRFLSLP
jgi:hypothetical protein